MTSKKTENDHGNLYGKVEVPARKPVDQSLGLDRKLIPTETVQAAVSGRGRGRGKNVKTAEENSEISAQAAKQPRKTTKQAEAVQHRGGRRTQNTGKASRTSAPQSAQPSAGVHKRTSAAAARTETAAPVQTTKRNSSRKGKKKQEVEKPSLRVYFLGGLNEIGKNFTLFECEGDMIIVDCGMAFPDGDMLGVDLVLPDFTFVERNADKIRGIFITHGHEDHIGALPYLLKQVNLPVYATRLTCGLIEGKLKEHGLVGKVKLNVTYPGTTIQAGCMGVEFIHVNHSIPDAVAFAIHSPAGVLVHTGDFKIDCTPATGEMIDLGRFAQLGNEGVLALLADSTNAERPGYTMTERKVDNSFENLFRRAENSRIIIASFASNIGRVQQIINCAVRYGRKVALSGRSMVNVMGIAMEMGYLDVPDGVLIDIDLLNRYPKEKVVLVTTGSQGEPMSALARMATSDHRKVEVGPDDFVIISARPIPGNEKTVGAVVDELLKQDCTVIYESMYDVHVSGHACQEELKMMQALTKPKYFIPVHGEQKHLRKHAGLAMAMGMPRENIFIGDIGNVLELSEEHMKQLPDVPAGDVLVDGLGVGDVGSIVLRDRKHLSEDGLIVAVCSIDAQSGKVVSGPDIVSRGFVYVRESEALMDEARDLVYNTLEECAREHVRDWSGMKQRIKDELSRFLYQKTRRSPMILPIIMEV